MAIPWIPLLSLGASIFGGAMGKTESQNTSENSTTTGATAQSSVGSGKTNQTQNQTSTQTSTEAGTGTSSENVSRLDATTKDLLTQQVQGLLGSADKGSAALTGQIDAVSGANSNFDPDAFVSGIMTSANANAKQDLDSTINTLGSRTGVSSNSNSMSALLENKMRTQTAANLSGINAEATGRAQDIVRANSESKTGQLATLAQGAGSELNGLLSNLLNASQTATGNTSQNTTGTTTGKTDTTATETSEQKQNTTGTTQQNTNSNANAAGQSNDWEKLFSGLAGAFQAQF